MTYLSGFPKRNSAQIKTSQLENLKTFLAQMEQSNRGLPEPPYTVADKEKLISDLKTQFPTGPLEREVYELTQGHAQRAFIIGWAGFLAIIVGFLFELVVALAPLTR
jgi:hypothetical protein